MSISNIKKVIIGTAQIGLDYGINNNTGKISEVDAIEILKYGYSSGIRFIDTAEVYGDAHEVIGKFHTKYQDSKFKVITKIPNHINTALEKKSCEYLNQLKVEKIDVLMYHSFETFYKDLGTSKKEMKRLKQKGIIEKTGVSIYTDEEFEKVIETDWIDVIQLPFNMFDNFSKRGELMLRAKEKEKIIHTRSAFLQGLFFIDRNKNVKIALKLKEYLEKIDRISEKSNIPLNVLALGYCINQPLIDKVLIGVDSLNQLVSNIDALKINIPERIMFELNKIEVPNVDLLNPSLWTK